MYFKADILRFLLMPYNIDKLFSQYNEKLYLESDYV
jgi:hypothetical protein